MHSARAYAETLRAAAVAKQVAKALEQKNELKEQKAALFAAAVVTVQCSFRRRSAIRQLQQLKIEQQQVQTYDS